MNVVSYGGGTNSTAMLILLRDTGIVPDLILFADTGGEKPETYSHTNVVSEWCAKNGFPRVLTVRKRGRIYVGETLEENCLRANMLPSIAYGFKGCSQKYKIQPQDMFCNNHEGCQATWKAGFKITKFIGYDADEGNRAKIAGDDKYEYRYPLMQVGWGRDECVEAIQKEGLPLPGKSACFFCPSSKKHEILLLRDKYPDLLARALKMEEQANLTSVKGLGRSFSWKDFLQSDADKRGEFSDAGKEIDCGCYDGE